MDPTPGKSSSKSAFRRARMNVKSACDNCRLRKVKCNGVQPCLQCQNRSSPLTYSQPDRRKLSKQRLSCYQRFVSILLRNPWAWSSIHPGHNNVRIAEQDIRTSADYEEFCLLVVWVEQDIGYSLRKWLTSSEEIDWEDEACRCSERGP